MVTEIPKNREEIAKKHVPSNLQNKVSIFVFEYEIEEWICKSLGIRFSNSKPSKALDDWYRTKKGREYNKNLSQFVNLLNIDFLKQNDPIFKKLIKLLK